MSNLITEITVLAQDIVRSLEYAREDTYGEPYLIDEEEIVKDCIISHIQDFAYNFLEESRR